MNVLLDAYAVLALLLDEPAADEVAQLMAEGAGVSTVDAAETLYRVTRSGVSADEATEYLVGLGVEIVHPPAEVMVGAGLLRARHFHHRKRPVSLADCVAAAHAIHLEVPLATSDGPLVEVLRDEQAAVEVLPDSRGMRPA